MTVALARYLVSREHSVSVVTMFGSEGDFFPLPEGVGRVCLQLGKETQGAQKLVVNFRRVSALRKVFSRERADVVLAMMTTSSILSIVAGLGLGIRIVASERNYPGLKRCALPWAILRRLFYRFANAHVAQTNETADWLRANTGAQGIHIIPNSVAWPVPDGPPAIAPNSFLTVDDRLLLAVGTKLHQKGFDLLLCAFATVAASHPEWQLMILGISSGSSEGRALVGLADELGVGSRVTLVGRVGNVAAWYSRADLFVLSSRYEGFPNVLLEAMAAGCACVAFDCDTGPRDIIEHGVDGVLVPPEDPGALAEALSEMMSDGAKREQLGSLAMHVRERFNEDRLMQEWGKVLLPSGS
jgi:glycosyltransferase involved in cell wall biosynthesis